MWLKPNGQLLVADYCKSSEELSPETEAFINIESLELIDITSYKKVHIIISEMYNSCLSLVVRGEWLY